MRNIELCIAKAMQSLKIAETTAYIGEPVSQLEHALQAAYFAEKSGHCDEVILACLLHDIGHYASHTRQSSMADLGIVKHEWIGAKLAYDMGFSKKVALLIGYHVDAKRYLAAKKNHYFEKLSMASRGTLAFQGGPMQTREMQQFENHPFFKEILQVRVNDEKAKEIGLDVPSLDYYEKKMRKHFETYQPIEDELGLMDFVDDAWVKKLKNVLSSNLLQI